MQILIEKVMTQSDPKRGVKSKIKKCNSQIDIDFKQHGSISVEKWDAACNINV